MKKVILLLLIGVVLVSSLSTANATMYSFGAITSNSGQQNDVAKQLSMEVTEVNGYVSFLFKNAVGITSTVQEIYFNDFTPAWLAYSGMSQSAGVVFGDDAAGSVLPGGNGAPYYFVASYGYDADKSGTGSNKVSQIINGIDDGDEYLNIVFSLNTGHTFSELIEALNDGGFRVGMHVQSIGTSEKSDSFINTPPVDPVPEPGTMVLLGAGMLGLAIFGKRRMNRE